MEDQDRIQYHSNRAMTELDLALRAGSTQAASAHFALSSLHFEHMRGLQSPAQTFAE
ncbi:MAG TPA: hypothetical protein VF628_11585 [Allosphingosinicella sp.]|jgi:hypothetical protein